MCEMTSATFLHVHAKRGIQFFGGKVRTFDDSVFTDNCHEIFPLCIARQKKRRPGERRHWLARCDARWLGRRGDESRPERAVPHGRPSTRLCFSLFFRRVMQSRRRRRRALFPLRAAATPRGWSFSSRAFPSEFSIAARAVVLFHSGPLLFPFFQFKRFRHSPEIIDLRPSLGSASRETGKKRARVEFNSLAFQRRPLARNATLLCVVIDRARKKTTTFL